MLDDSHLSSSDDFAIELRWQALVLEEWVMG
jgi:hypothetical protein